ncbi:MAG: cation diffusion facilitator family transporter [Synergistales bacterium]
MDRETQAVRVTWIGLAVNTVLTLFKYVAGFLGGSAAMIADATHSLTDLVTDIVVILGFRIVRKPADETHDYGHGKVEALLAGLCGITLIAAGFGIFWSGTHAIWHHFTGQEIGRPGMIAFVAAIISVVSKEWLYRYTIVWGRKLNSNAVIAKAWDHRSDAFSSIGTTLGIGGALFLGEPARILDPMAAVIVSVFIVRAAIPILKECMDELLEASLCEEHEKVLENLILSVEGIRGTHKLRTRKIGPVIAIDVHILMDESLSLVEAHEISTRVEHLLRDNLGTGTYISLHMEPVSYYLPVVPGSFDAPPSGSAGMNSQD